MTDKPKISPSVMKAWRMLVAEDSAGMSEVDVAQIIDEYATRITEAARIRWTSEKPIKTGWYPWRRWSNDGCWEVVKVIRPNKELLVSFAGQAKELTLEKLFKNYHCAQWGQRIKEPG